MGLTLEYLVIMAWEGGDDGGVSGDGGLERGKKLVLNVFWLLTRHIPLVDLTVN